MKAHWAALIPALAFATAFNQSSSVVAQSAATPANPSFAGTWEGKMTFPESLSRLKRQMERLTALLFSTFRNVAVPTERGM